MKQLSLFPDAPLEIGDRVSFNNKGRARGVRSAMARSKRELRGTVKDVTENRLWILVMIDDYGLISCCPESLKKLRG